MNTMIICITIIVSLLIVGVSVTGIMAVYLNHQKEMAKDTLDRLEKLTDKWIEIMMKMFEDNM